MKTFALAFSLSLFSTAQLHAQASFFEGKTIRIVVGLPAGDVYDIYARLLATYMGKYIPGNPSLMVQNMPGAASMIAANYGLGFRRDWPAHHGYAGHPRRAR